jgi:hypothetical protein
MEDTVQKTRRICEDNVKMNVREIGCEGVDRIQLAHVRVHSGALANAVMKLPARKNIRREFLDQLSKL